MRDQLAGRDYLDDRDHPDKYDKYELRKRYLERHQEIIRLQALNAADLADIDRTAAYDPEYLSATAFVRYEAGVSGSEAARLVGEARGLSRHDHIREAFESARIDRPRVTMLLKAVNASPETFTRDEKVLVDTISELSMKDARRAIDYWRQAADQRSALEDEQHLRKRRRLNLSKTLEGMWRLDGWLDPESGAIVKTALDVMVDPTFLDDQDTRTAPQSRADALTDLCNDYLAHDDTPTRGGVRPHITLHITPEVLQGEPGEPSELEGIVISTATARRYACDPTISALLRDGEAIVGVGRATRKIPPSIRHALDARDGGCTWSGCDAPTRFCDGHHIIHWINGGETELENLRLLCRRHHTLIHELEGADPGEPRGP